MTFVETATALMKWFEEIALSLRSIEFWGISIWDTIVASLLVGVACAFLYGGSNSNE